MNRYVRAATAALLVAGGLGSAGCAHKSGSTCGNGTGSDMTCGDKYRNCIDTNWPDRYNYAARQATLYPFAQQAANGHFVEQTIWNWHFEPGSDKLNSAGLEKLNSLSRKTPGPDTKIYIQAARDVPPTPENADRLPALRDELTAKRAAAIQKHMATQPGNPVTYELAVHDAPTPGIHAPSAAGSFRSQAGGYSGGLSGGGGGAPSVSSGTNLLVGPGGTASGPAGPTGPGSGTPSGPGY